jgi:cytochrome P450
MSNAPIYEIDPNTFRADPYPDLAKMRRNGGIHFVPQLNATLFTRRADIFVCEKNIDVFSSRQPGGLMDELMGQNMMRKDGLDHTSERRAVFPALSPRTVTNQWKASFEQAAEQLLEKLTDRGTANLVSDYAMPLSGAALQVITGLTNMEPAEMDRVSQGMIDGIANYAGNVEVAAYCKDCTTSIDRHIDERIETLRASPDKSLLSVQMEAGLSEASVRANMKLAISGGQNEPRDAIAGASWALISHPDQLAAVERGSVTWRAAFEEYARWISPIGMSPRRVDQAFNYKGVKFEPEDRVFFMFGAANRDEAEFKMAEAFDVMRDTGRAIAFGAGPHFCAGAAASRVLIAEVALPMLFARLQGLRLVEEPVFEGWAFRGPKALHVAWDV